MFLNNPSNHIIKILSHHQRPFVCWAIGWNRHITFDVSGMRVRLLRSWHLISYIFFWSYTRIEWTSPNYTLNWSQLNATDYKLDVLNTNFTLIYILEFRRLLTSKPLNQSLAPELNHIGFAFILNSFLQFKESSRMKTDGNCMLSELWLWFLVNLSWEVSGKH